MVKQFLGCLLLMYSICSCSSVEDNRNGIVKTVAEKVSGVTIEQKNLNQTNENQVEFNFSIDEYGIADKFNNAWGAVTATKNTIAITITSKKNENEHILLGLTGKDYTQVRPISCSLSDNTMSFSSMSFSNNAMNAMMSSEAQCEIEEWSSEKISIRISGSLSTVEEYANKKGGLLYEGTIILYHPLINAMGNEIKDFEY